MTTAVDERARLDRQEVKEWMYAAWRASGKPQRVLSELMGLDYHWLGNRLAPSCDVFPSPDQLLAFSTLTKHPLSESLLSRWEQLETTLRLIQDGRHVVLDLSKLEPMLEDGTGETEMANLINLAHSSKRQVTTLVDRNVQFMRLRFGVGRKSSMTLAEVGDQFGLSRERVRQVEAKMLKRLAAVAVDITTPALDAIRLAAAGKTGQPLDQIEVEMRPRLGAVALMDALRFYQAIRPGGELLKRERAVIYGFDGVQVLAGSRADLRWIQVVSTCARKLQSYCGACQITDLRGFVESVGNAPVATADLLRAVEALPGMAWLNGGKRWFWFPQAEMTGLLQRACLILSLAGAPVDFEILYAGLLRESRRGRDSDAAEFTEAAPPSGTMLAMLDSHPAFVRRAATSFALAIPFDPAEYLEAYHQALVAALNAHGGVMPRHELREVKAASGKAFSAGYLTITLYLSAFIERLGPSVYGIRGRPIANADLVAALDRSMAFQEAAGYSGFSAMRRPVDAPTFSIVIPLTPMLKRNRLVGFRRASVPVGAGGDYLLPDGHVCTLVDDKHSVRLISLGARINQLIDAPEGALEFAFDIEAREASVRVVASDG